jgi:hypothetical protein
LFGRSSRANTPTATARLQHGGGGATLCVAQFQCAGPFVSGLQWHPTQAGLLAASTAVAGDAFAQATIVEVRCHRPMMARVRPALRLRVRVCVCCAACAVMAACVYACSRVRVWTCVSVHDE